MRKRPPEDLVRAGDLLDQGLSYYRVARIIGCSKYYLQSHFPGRGRYREPVSDLDRDRARQWLAQGISYREVGRRLGVRGSTVAGWFPGASHHPPVVPMTASDLDFAARLLADGASYEEVGRTLGREGETIRLRFPGQGWTEAQRVEHVRTVRDLTDGHWIWGGAQDRRATHALRGGQS